MNTESIEKKQMYSRVQVTETSSYRVRGVDLVKVAKYTNIVIGTALVTLVILNFVSLGFLSPFDFTMSVFQG